MATIIVLGVCVPHTSGGQEALIRTLCEQLKLRGHRVANIDIPTHIDSHLDLIKELKIVENISLNEFAGYKTDLVIATKFPSYFSKATKKSVWLVHQHRPAYDLYGTQFTDFSDSPRSEMVRRYLYKADSLVLSQADYVAGISKNVVERTFNFNGIKSDVLYPPLPAGGKYYNLPSNNYILLVGRICRIKRHDLIIKALPFLPPEIKLKIAGKADDAKFYDHLKCEIKKHHLTHRVEFLGSVTESELLKLYAECMAVFYAPFDEDYGYVSLEAMASSKAVISATDSGGVLEFVQNNNTGLVVNPDTVSIANAINILFTDEQLRKKMGENGRNLIEKADLLDNGWNNVINSLLSPLTNKLTLTNHGDNYSSII
jgi:glycosyltransferase involved in cell wall biosynthesis